MAIVVTLDVMLARRKMRSRELAERIGITEANVSLLKGGHVKGVRFETLEKNGFIESVKITLTWTPPTEIRNGQTDVLLTRLTREPVTNTYTTFEQRNPVGSYRRTIEIPTNWAGRHVFTHRCTTLFMFTFRPLARRRGRRPRPTGN